MIEFTCKTCGIKFKPPYRLASKRTLHFCGRKCKTVFQRQGYLNKAQLENSIIKVIKEKGSYMVIQEIISELNISSKTLTKFRISALGLNRKCGMAKPKSMFEFRVYEVLNGLFEDMTSQQTFSSCVSPKGYELKFDFYSAERNLIVEADGDQHQNDSSIYSSEYTIECDNIKNQWCIDEGITLVRIPYSRNVTANYVNKYVQAYV
jgi:hypothetical protein